MEPIKIFLAGGKGSGKTTYFASLFGKYVATDGESGLYCKVDPDAHKTLSSNFLNLKNGEWPRQTAVTEIKTLRFDFMIRSPKEAGNTEYLAMSLIAYDYPGGIFTGDDIDDPQDPASELAMQSREKILNLASTADAWIIFIDGDKLSQSLARGELDYNLNSTLLTQISSFTTSNISPKTTYLVITKWDQFIDSDASISAAQTILLTNPIYKQFIKNQRLAKKTTRLVPISSVGPRFTHRSSNGSMPINADSAPDPQNLEAPLATTIIDKIRDELAKNKSRLEAEAHRAATQYAGEVDLWKKLLNGAAIFAQNSSVIDSIRRELGVNRSSLESAVLAMTIPYNKSKQEIEAKRAQNMAKAAEIRSKIRSNDTAAEYGINVLLNAYMAYEEKYPSAKIAG